MNMTTVCLISLLCAQSLVSVNSENLAPVVQTNYGNVQGMTKNYPDGPVLQYVGIPFAAPPTGSLRFEKPMPHRRWRKTLMATQFGPSCMQYLFQNDGWLIPNKNISEDCLQLNIFIPHSINQTQPKTVMIWIHGGGFYAGQATLFDGSYLALKGDVIIVTINYRLGLFGFLSTEDEVAPGNYGLWDQHFAFKWVKENIANFGGNPTSVCIFGESAGGYSVGLHTVSPVNRNYFQRAISESGAVRSPRALASGAKEVAMKAGTLLNCSNALSVDLIRCLRSISAENILQVQSKAQDSPEGLRFINRLGPVLDGEFVTEDLNNFLKNAKSPAYEMFKSVAVMAGTNNAEGGLMYFSLMSFQERFKFNISVGIPRSVLCDVVAPAVSRDYYNGSTAVSKAICDEYTVNGSATEQSRSILDVYAHKQFVMPTIWTNMGHASIGVTPTYHYLFSHQPTFSWIQDRPGWLKGANHAGELPFVFGLYAMYKNSSQKPQAELSLSRQLMIYWSNFAKTGNPNQPVSGVPKWPAFGTEQRGYMDLKINPQSGVKAFDDKYRFWTETVPHLVLHGTLDPGNGVTSVNGNVVTPMNGNDATTHSGNGVTPLKDDRNTGAQRAIDLLLCCVFVFLPILF